MKSRNIVTESASHKSIPALGVVERTYRYLAKISPAISGEQGHDATYRAACTLLRGFALSPEISYALLMGAFDHRCTPPWSDPAENNLLISAGDHKRILAISIKGVPISQQICLLEVTRRVLNRVAFFSPKRSMP